MWKKITAVTMICILCAFFSFRITDAAEVSGTKQDVTDYKQISALISDTWDDDYFEKMVITPGTDTMEKDGEQEQVSDTFDVSSSKAKSITKSEDVLDNYLDKQDGVYEVKENMDGDLEVTAPYQTKRLIVESNQVKDTCGASEVYVNEMDHETILQYDSEEKTEEAFQQLSRTYSSCYPDKVVSIEDSTMGLPLSQGGENGQGTYSWGSDYMGLNELKKQAASNGYTRRVTVAVVDTGIDTSNVLFAGRKVSSQSYNFFGNNYNVQDTFGHGTHVSGIIADATPANVELLVLRVSNNEGKSSLLTIKTALQYAVSKNADVVNLSMGFIDVNASLYDYLDSTIDKAYKEEFLFAALPVMEKVEVKVWMFVIVIRPAIVRQSLFQQLIIQASSLPITPIVEVPLTLRLREVVLSALTIKGTLRQCQEHLWQHLILQRRLLI